MTTREEQERLYADLYASWTPSKRQFADDVSKRAQDIANQRLIWVEELLNVLNVLLVIEQGRLPWPVVRMFWIRLHGVLKELPPEFSTAKEVSPQVPPETRSLITYGARIYDRIAAVRDCLADDEVVFTDYHRQRACHLRQDAFRVQYIAKRDEIRAERRIEHIDRTFSIDEVDALCARLCTEHGGEAGVAVALAHRLLDAVKALVEAFRELHALPDM